MSSTSRPFTIPATRAERWSLLSDLFKEWHTPLSLASGYTTAEISACETRLGLKLPLALREWYELAGKREDIWNLQDHLAAPDDITVEKDILVFYFENQYVTAWGSHISQLTIDNPPVFTRDENGFWREQCPSISLFAIQMFLHTLQFAASSIIYGFAQEAALHGMISAFSPLPIPPFLLPGGAFHFYGDRDLIVNIDSTGHVSAAAKTSADLERFRMLLSPSDFEILHEKGGTRDSLPN